MGLFDFFKRDKNDDGETKSSGDKKIDSLGKKASDKRSQSYDRDEAIRALIDMGTPLAAEALLKRFTLKVDPSITDQDEKQLAFEGIVSIGRGERRGDEDETPFEDIRAQVVESTRTYCQNAENLTWALKVMRELLDDDAYVEMLLGLLEPFDTEYTRNIEPKINLLAAMEDLEDPRLRMAAEEYLDDVNETVRFHAVQTTFAQGDPASLPPLVVMMKTEESVRIKNKVCDGVATAAWSFPEETRDDLQQAMKDVYEYRLTADLSVERA